MSTKTLVIVIIGAGLLALLIGGYIGWTLKPVKICPIITDSVYVQGDTVLVPYPVEVIKWKEKQPVVYDSTEQEYEAYFDSSFASNKDTIDIDVAVVFSEKGKTFEIDMDIEHKDYHSIRIDTIKVNYTEIKEVEVSDPLWKYTTAIGLLLLILSIIFGG